MSLPIRKSIKVILLNQKNELLLMCADDPKTTAAAGKYHGRFWFLIGGKIEPNESILEAATREVYEETGIKKDEIVFGSIVWYGEFDLTLDGVLTHIEQSFIVAKTEKNDVSLTAPVEWEKKVVKKLAWFSYDNIKDTDEIIYPVVLSEYLPDILAGNYPKKPIKIDLAKQPIIKAKKV